MANYIAPSLTELKEMGNEDAAEKLLISSISAKFIAVDIPSILILY